MILKCINHGHQHRGFFFGKIARRINFGNTVSKLFQYCVGYLIRFLGDDGQRLKGIAVIEQFDYLSRTELEDNGIECPFPVINKTSNHNYCHIYQKGIIPDILFKLIGEINRNKIKTTS